MMKHLFIPYELAVIAKEKGFAYVLDSATLLVADGTDIMVDAKAKLGVK